MTPALRALHQGSPSPSVHLIVPSGARRVAEMFPFSDAILPINASRQLYTLEMATGRYDAAVVFTDRDRSPYPEAYLCYLAGIPLRVGLSAEFGGGVLSHWVKPLSDADPIDRHLTLAGCIGFQEKGRHLELRVPPGLQAKVDAEICATGLELDKPFVSIFCLSTLGPGLADLLSGYARRNGDCPASSESSCFLVDIGRGLCAVMATDRGEDINAALAARSYLVVTDSPLTACLSQAVGSPVLYVDTDATGSRNEVPRWFATVEGKGLACGGTSPGPIARYINDFMGSCRMGREAVRSVPDHRQRTGER